MTSTTTPDTEATVWRRGTVEIRTFTEVDPALADRLWALYAAAFEPLRARAAARQVMTRAEFDLGLADPRMTSFVAFDHHEPVGLAALATNLAAVPWVSPEYYAARYPDAAGRDAIRYIVYACTDTGRARPSVLWWMTQAVVAHFGPAMEVLAYDICAANNQTLDFARKMEVWYRRLGARQVQQLDTQHYYAAEFERTVWENGQSW